MRLQIRVGVQYPELMEHLESFKPEHRGRRLLALAAMQLSGQAMAKVSVTDQDADEKVGLVAEQPPVKMDELPEANAQIKRTPPTWITHNAVS